jgi:hypothetical protein
MKAAYIQTSAGFQDVESLEQQLMRSLRPVQPNRQFVDHLHSRLTTPVDTTVERRQHLGFSLLLIAGSLASGVFVVWLIRQFRGNPAL